MDERSVESGKEKIYTFELIGIFYFLTTSVVTMMVLEKS